jgi:hypothetical protein
MHARKCTWYWKRCANTHSIYLTYYFQNNVPLVQINCSRSNYIINFLFWINLYLMNYILLKAIYWFWTKLYLLIHMLFTYVKIQILMALRVFQIFPSIQPANLPNDWIQKSGFSYTAAFPPQQHSQPQLAQTNRPWVGLGWIRIMTCHVGLAMKDLTWPGQIAHDQFFWS